MTVSDNDDAYSLLGSIAVSCFYETDDETRCSSVCFQVCSIAVHTTVAVWLQAPAAIRGWRWSCTCRFSVQGRRVQSFVCVFNFQVLARLMNMMPCGACCLPYTTRHEENACPPPPLGLPPFSSTLPTTGTRTRRGGATCLVCLSVGHSHL